MSHLGLPSLAALVLTSQLRSCGYDVPNIASDHKERVCRLIAI